jgi:hypothetical protein
MRRTLLAALAALALVALAGAPAEAAAKKSCVPKASKDRGSAVTRARAAAVVDKYALRTMQRCDGVVGMGVGAAKGVQQPDPDAAQHVIVIMLRDKASKPRRARSISAVTIRYVVTGPFVPL